jgi:hypothetical protein
MLHEQPLHPDVDEFESEEEEKNLKKLKESPRSTILLMI